MLPTAVANHRQRLPIPVRQMDPEARKEYERERKRRQRSAKKQDELAAKVEADRALLIIPDAIADFAWGLRVPSGRLAGERFRLQDWQTQFLAGAFAEGVVEAGLSVARKNGKSGLVAAILLAHFYAPLRVPGWRGIVTSMTGRLGAELWHAMESIARASQLEGLTFTRSPLPGRVSGPEDCRLDFLAADRATGHALGADLAVIDEAGLMQENQRGLFNAVLSATSGRDGRLLCISILGDGPMFRELRQRGKAKEPGVFWQEHAASPTAALDDEDAWAAANPGLGTIKGRAYMEHAARRALASPSDQAAFRAYDLNQPQSPERELIVSVTDWARCTVSEEELPRRDGPCCLGVDIGGSSSMTAAVAYWPRSHRLEVWGAFPAHPDLRERGQSDGVGGLYVRMQDAGELSTYPGRVTDVAAFFESCANRLAGETVRMAADRYRRAEVEQAMADAGLTWPVEWRGRGHSHTADGSADVRAFQKQALSGRIKTVRSLMMEQAIAQSSVVRDAAGNPKLSKATAMGRIDALQAGVLAAGLGARAPSLFGGGAYLGTVE